MRSLILTLALAASARAAVKARTAPRDAAAAFFHNPAATVLHETARHPTRSPYAGENPVPPVNLSYLDSSPARHRRGKKRHLDTNLNR